ncbi:hypothetical protein [Streptomyces sp. NPDC102490]|uniref:helix-turn-helix domain-containing protein n=1 Tax=Streptomyces sp. NPDC102490 TaxID=3366183 RepID=UPI0038178F76
MVAVNASIPLPSDPLVALWQQLTVLREWRDDAHFTVLAANDIGPCECTVLQSATGHFPEAIARATRLWNDEEAAAATTRLVARGWLNSDGTATDAGWGRRLRVCTPSPSWCGHEGGYRADGHRLRPERPPRRCPHHPPPAQATDCLARLPVEALHGIEPRRANTLHDYGMHTVGLLAAGQGGAAARP